MLLPIVAGGPGDQFSESANPQGNPLGSRMYFADGREFAACRAGAIVLVAGALNQQTIPDTDYDQLAVLAAAVGDNEVSVTTGSTALAVDEAADGYLNIEDDAGEGHLYTIKSHPAIGTSSTGVLTLYDSLQVAITTATTVQVALNAFGVVIIHPSPPLAMIVGVSPHALPITNYGWLQRRGPASVLTEGVLEIYRRVVPGDNVDGSVESTVGVIVDGTPPVGHGEIINVGVCIEIAATEEHSLIFMDM